MSLAQRSLFANIALTFVTGTVPAKHVLTTEHAVDIPMVSIATASQSSPRYHLIAEWSKVITIAQMNLIVQNIACRTFVLTIYLIVMHLQEDIIRGP